MAEGLRARTKRKASYFEQESEDEEYEEVKEMEDDDYEWEEPVRKSKSEDFCTICKTGGKVLCCDSCTAVFHLECLDPPMKAVPKGTWSCPSCIEPLAAIEKFLDCEMRPLGTSPGDKEPEPVKQYLVKWKSRSYLHCSWIPLAEIERAAKMYPGIRMKLNHFNKQWSDLKEAKDTEEYVPIRPEWVTVDRIIDRRDKGEAVEYLVKWKELGYDEATWEFKKDLQAFQPQIGKYKRIMAKGTRKTKKKSDYKIQSAFAHYAETPRFLADGLSLHPYQLEGLNFLRFAWQQEKHVILADEMGLGKTIQSIAFLASLIHEGVFDPHLVVAPLSTLRNWEREFATWAPHIQIVVYAGNASARNIIRDTEFYYPKLKDGKTKKRHSEKKQSKQDRIKFDVLLTSYEMITTDATNLKSIKWECLIVDEGHRLKSKDSKLFQTLQTFTTHHRVLLTGTPLQNNLDELFTLMHFLDADKFASLEDFQQEFRNINQEEQVVRLHKMLASHLLRRVKKDVLKQLPPKKELMLRVELSSMQKEYYKAILTRNFDVLSRPGVPPISLNNVVMELRKLCGHPYMLEGVEPEYENEEEVNRQRIEGSGKLLLLDKLMMKLKEKGHRVLIYSQFQRMLDILEDWLTSKNWSYERIDGSVTGTERQIRIDRYNAPNSNRFCFLLSTRAGGLGINLATADTVIIYDSDWNPHADLQAMARAHRLGQKNMVMIYRLVARGSIEERMMQMTKKKMVLEHLVVGRIKQTLKQEELDDILRYGAKNVFADENDESAKAWQIHYDDTAIDKLLDRSATETGHEMPQEEEDNDLLKAFKVANFEYVNNEIGRKADADREAEADYEADHLSTNDRMQYWENLLKDRYDKQQATELGKGKRARKPIKHSEDDLAGMQYTSSDGEDSDDHLDMDYKEVENRRKNYAEDSGHKIIEGDGKSLKVLGFRRKHRALFVQLLMRFGLGDLTWSAFVPHFEQKSLEEIQAYGTLFLKHISGHNDDSPKFPDGVPKEGLRVKDVCVRLAVLHLIEMKLHQCWQSPNMKLFPDAIHAKFPALRSFYFWKEEHDRALLEGIMKYGYGCWSEILEDSQYGLQSIVREELKRVFITDEETEVHMTTKRTMDFIKKRMCLLESALHSEHQLEDHNNQDEVPMEHDHKEFNIGPEEFNQTSTTYVPFLSPLSPEDIAATALNNDPKRLSTAKLYNDMCSLVAENRNDAFQTYAGNKSAGVRLRKSIRQLDQICSEMRRGLGAKTDSSEGAQPTDRDDISDTELDPVRVKVVTID